MFTIIQVKRTFSKKVNAMKRNFTVFAYVVATMAMLASCAREKEGAVDYPAVPEGEGIHVLVVGDGQVDYNETKTAAVEVDPSKTYVKWLSNDKIDVWETSVNGETASSKRFTSGAASNLTEEGGYADIKADFGVTFTGTAEGSEYFYTAVYPAGAVEKSSTGDFYFFAIPSTQTLSSDGNFAANADVMIGTPIRRTERVAEGNKLAYSFSRPGTVVKLRLKGIHSGEVINSITIDAPVNITGRSKINLTTGEISDVAYYADGSLPKTRLQINGNDFTSDGDDDVWVRILSGTWTAGSSLSITVDTDKAVYTKSYENNLPKDFVFAEGGLTKFGFSFGDGNREEKSTPTEYTLVKSTNQLVDGATYIIVGRYTSSTSHYYSTVEEFFKSTQTKFWYETTKIYEGGSQSDALLESLTVESTTTYVPFKLKALASSQYALQNTTNDKFAGINGTSNASMTEYDDTDDANAKYTIGINDKTYKASIASVGQSGRGIYANLQSSRFSSYTNDQSNSSTYLYVDLSTVKAQLAAPSVSAVAQDLATAIKVTCAPVATDKEGNALEGASLVYTLTVTGETDVDPIVLTDADLVEGQYVKTVSDLAYGSYVVNVTVSDANEKYRSSYGETDVELVQPELQALTMTATADAPARKITIEWIDVKDKDTESVSATSYQLYDGETKVGSVVGADVETIVLSGESVEWGHEYHFTLVASLAGYVSSLSNEEVVTVTQPQLSAPAILTEANATAKTILVTWGDVANATHYEVYNGEELAAAVTAGVEFYTFENITYDVDYTITVKAVNRVNTNYLPATSEAAVVNVHNPATIGDFEVLTDVDTPNSVYVTWGEAENATSYDVTLYAGEEEVASETGLTVIEHTFSGVDAGNAYTVSVTAKADGMDDLVKYADGTLTVRNATISYATVTGGTITSEPSGNAKVGTTVTLGNTPATGYELTANSYTVNSEALAGDSFTITGDVTVSGTFHKIDYTITAVGDNASHITIKNATASSVISTANYGDKVTLVAESVSGYKFSSWTVTNTATSATITVDAHNQFTMPAGNVEVSAEFEEKPNTSIATYTVTSTTSVNVSGTTPAGSSATFNNTYTSNKEQITSGKSQTLTLKGYQGKIVKSITLTMHSNGGAGAGTLSVKAGTTTLASIGSATNFDDNAWNGAYTTTYTDVTPSMSNTNYTVKKGEDIVIVIAATTNSLFCQKFAVEYADDPNYVESYSINLTQPTGGEIDAKVNGSSVTEAQENALVTLSVVTTPTGKTFKSWTVTKQSGGTVTVTNNSFTMPAESVTVSASFTGGTPDPDEYAPSNFTGGGTSGTGGATTATVGNSTVSTDKGYIDSGHIRVYSGGMITITSTTPIKKIEITSTASGTASNGPSKIGKNTGESGSYSYSGSVGTWINNSGDTEVKLKASAQFRFTKIKVYYE